MFSPSSVVSPTVTLSAMAAGSPSAKMQTFELTVTKPVPDFAIAVSAIPNTTVANQTVTWNGTLTAVNEYGGSVTLSCTSGAPGTCGFAPATVTPTVAGAPFTVTLSSATALTFDFTIQGTDGTLTHATPTETLTVGTDVAWTDTGNASGTVRAGQSASYTFSAAPAGGEAFSAGVSFACTGLPLLTSGAPGANCVFNPTTIAAGAGTSGVTLTIWTCGPNLPTLCPAGTGGDARPSTGTIQTAGGSRPEARERHNILPFFTLAWVAMAGIVGLGRTRGGKPRRFGVFAGICLGLGSMALLSCGGVAGGGGTTPPPVTVNPPTGTVLYADEPGNSWPAGGNQQQFTANQSVTWAVTGGSANGTVDGTGMYTPPAVVPNPATVTVTATAAGGAAGSAFVTVAAPTALGTSQVTVTATAAGGPAHSDAVTLIVQ